MKSNTSEKRWLILEGDYGGQKFLICPCGLVGVNARIQDLLQEMNEFTWKHDHDEATFYRFISNQVDDDKDEIRLWADDLNDGLWVDDEFHTPINDPAEADCHCCRIGLHVRQDVHNMKWFKRITKLLDLDNPNKKNFHEET